MKHWQKRQHCWDNGIFIREKPVEQGYTKKGFNVKLNLEMNKKIVKFGKKEYPQNSILLYDTIRKYYNEIHRIYLE